MNAHVKETTDAAFAADVLQSDTPVLVDFWAPWCGPCRAMAPAIDALAEEVAGQARVVKLDIDANQATAVQFHIRAVPTLMVFKAGAPVATHVGAATQTRLRELLRAA